MSEDFGKWLLVCCLAFIVVLIGLVRLVPNDERRCMNTCGPRGYVYHSEPGGGTCACGMEHRQ